MRLKPVCYGPSVVWLIGKPPYSTFYLIEGPVAGFNSKLSQLNALPGIVIAPTRRAGREDIQIGRTLGAESLLGFGD